MTVLNIQKVQKRRQPSVSLPRLPLAPSRLPHVFNAQVSYIYAFIKQAGVSLPLGLWGQIEPVIHPMLPWLFPWILSYRSVQAGLPVLVATLCSIVWLGEVGRLASSLSAAAVNVCSHVCVFWPL